MDAPSDGRAPKKLKLFANQLGLDFDSAEDAQADQTIELTPDIMGKRLELKFVKFQSVDRHAKGFSAGSSAGLSSYMQAHFSAA